MNASGEFVRHGFPASRIPCLCIRSALAQQLDQVVQFLVGRFVAGKRAEEDGQLGDELFVFEDVIGDAPGIYSGVVEEFEPVFRALFEAQVLRPGAEEVGNKLLVRADSP